MSDTFLDHLNPAQQRAVSHPGGPLLILAGAGSGKTRCLTHRVAWLMSEQLIRPSRIVLLTFTNKAAGEMKKRVRDLLINHRSPTIDHQLPWAGTFHSWCVLFLRRHGQLAGLKPDWVIYDEDDSQQLMREIINDLGLPTKKFRPRSILAAISGAKNEMVNELDYPQFAKGEWQEGVAAAYLEYQKRLNRFGALDFDDLLLTAVKLLVRDPSLRARYQEQIQHLLVDEYQDTNTVQYRLTALLAGRHRNLTVVGDMAQSIYTFRGAHFRHLLNLRRDFPDLTEVRLEQNYRSHQSILDAAHSLIRHNRQHPVLKLWTERGSAAMPKLYAATTEMDEAQFVLAKIQERELRTNGETKPGNFAVLFRTNAQSRVFEEAFLTAGVPYALIGGIRFYQRAEIKDCLAYLRLLFNPDDGLAQTRVLKLGQKRYQAFRTFATSAGAGKTAPGSPRVSATTRTLLEEVLAVTNYLSRFDPEDPEDQVRLENIRELTSVAEAYPRLGEFLTQVALMEDAQLRQANTPNSVILMTFHSAKGLEFPVVFLVGLEEGLLPHSRSMLVADELEEERRLMYVGITRAMDEVYLTYARSRLFFGSRGVSIPSRFIGEIGEENLERI